MATNYVENKKKEELCFKAYSSFLTFIKGYFKSRK